MQSVRKDYLLVLTATVLASVIGLLIFNAGAILNNNLIWQTTIFATGSFVLFSVVRMYQLSQKVSEQLKPKKVSNN